MILAGKEQPSSSSKSTLTWNFDHSYMFSRPELMWALVFLKKGMTPFINYLTEYALSAVT